MRIREFWVRFRKTKPPGVCDRVRVRTASNMIMFKIYWNLVPAFNNVARAKKLQMQVEFCSIIFTRK